MNLSDRLFRASAAVRAMISRQALEELGGAKPGRRVKAEKGLERHRQGGGLSRRNIDLSFPAPPRWRPMTTAGATSFHFSLSSVSNVRPAGRKAPNGALAFERYITAEQDRATVNERYVVDRDEGVEGKSRTAFVVSNISRGAAERERFWTAVSAAASTPSPPVLKIRPACGDLSELIRLTEDAATPRSVREALREVVDASNAGNKTTCRRVHRIELDNHALPWAEALDISRYGSRRDERLIHFVHPRGGVLQWQIEAEFPDELGDHDNRAIADAFGSLLDKLGLKYTIAAHESTHRNDPRNRHPHILIYPGACRQGYDGQWEFRGGKLQPGDLAARLGEATREELLRLSFKQRSAADVAALRHAFAKIVNDRLIACGVRRRYDPRTYVEMGIDQAPGEHLGSAAAALVDAGFAVEIDRRNAVKAWSARQRQAEREIAAELDQHDVVLHKLDAAAPAGDEDELARLRLAYEDARDRLAKTLRAVADWDLSTEMARSAAERLAAKTSDVLAAIADGSASAAEARAVATYRARSDIACAHLDAVNEAIEPHGDTVRAARREVANLRQNLAQLDRKIDAAIERQSVCESRDRTTRRWADDTVLMPDRYPMPLDGEAHFDALLEHLTRQRSAEWSTPANRFVFIVRSDSDSKQYAAIGLRPADRTLVAQQPYKRRFDAVLQEAGKLQDKEIGRVIDYIAAHGEASLLGSDSGAPHRTVRRHYRLYRHHPRFGDLLPGAQARFDASQRSLVNAPPAAGQPAAVLSAEPAAVADSVLEERPIELSATVTTVVIKAVVSTKTSRNLSEANARDGCVASASQAAMNTTIQSAAHIPPQIPADADISGDKPDRGGGSMPLPAGRDALLPEASDDEAEPSREDASSLPTKASSQSPAGPQTAQSDGAETIARPSLKMPGERQAQMASLTSEAVPTPLSSPSDAADKEHKPVAAAATLDNPVATERRALGAPAAAEIAPKRTTATTSPRSRPQLSPESDEVSSRPTLMEQARRLARQRAPMSSAATISSPTTTSPSVPDHKAERLELARQVVRDFREHTLYQRLPKAEREVFEAALVGPMTDLVDGHSSLRIENGKLLAAGRHDEIIDRLRVLAVSDCGYWLLVNAAKSMPAEPQTGKAWAVIDQTGVAAATPASIDQGRGHSQR
ncbi:MobA/MobL family protein [Sphingomonas floccifaciens]|uniref:MobA/MobL family protein n=1 Tax=Sphingomonas floccifaciens TaxID=1844115 RepID=A0ABW4NGQ2_9SPHN|nr:MobA/MobL family protein [Roseomonas aeriglobus]